MTNLRVCSSCLPLLVLAGCGAGAAAPDVGSVSEALVTTNGHEQNGHEQNGHEQNGPALAMAGVDLTTMQRLINVPPEGGDPDLSPGNLVPVFAVALQGSMLANGFISGTRFAGHVVSGTVTDGAHIYPATFYIEKIDVSPIDPEIYHYQIRTLHPLADGGQDCTVNACPSVWDYGCGVRHIRIHNHDGSVTMVDRPYQATALGGQWDFHQGNLGDGRKLIEQGNPDYDTKVTFACETGAIGKCVEKMGYKPWSPAAPDCRTYCGRVGRLGPICRDKCTTPTRELLHEACVRMVRADYCGDGVSHTVDGIGIDVWDSSNINVMSSMSTATDGYGHEGEWTPTGARCLSDALMGRISSDVDSQLVVQYLHAHCGTKWNTQPNQPPNTPFIWELNDCFGKGPSSQHSTWDYANVPDGFDQHDRVFIKNTSMCIVDRERTNSYMSFPPCLRSF